MGQNSFVPGGKINPARFVKMMGSTGGNRVVVVATAATDKIVGISQVGSHNPPFLTLADSPNDYAADVGGSINVYNTDDPEAWLELGEAANPGDLLMAGAAGVGMKASGTGSVYYGAEVLNGGALGEIVKVKPRFGLL